MAEGNETGTFYFILNQPLTQVDDARASFAANSESLVGRCSGRDADHRRPVVRSSGLLVGVIGVLGWCQPGPTAADKAGLLSQPPATMKIQEGGGDAVRGL